MLLGVMGNAVSFVQKKALTLREIYPAAADSRAHPPCHLETESRHSKNPFRSTLIAFGLLLAFVPTALSQESGPAVADFEEANLSVELSTALQAQGEGIVGDSISLADGSLSFAHTDVSLPGNSGLPVAFTRSYSVGGVSYFGDILGGWHLDVPMITTRARTTLVVGGSLSLIHI